MVTMRKTTVPSHAAVVMSVIKCRIHTHLNFMDQYFVRDVGFPISFSLFTHVFSVECIFQMGTVNQAEVFHNTSYLGNRKVVIVIHSKGAHNLLIARGTICEDHIVMGISHF